MELNHNSNSSDFVCKICNTTFESRNKLFRHVKTCSTGSAVLNHSKVAQSDKVKDMFLYVVGGRVRGRTLRSTERFSFQKKLWEECAPMLENRGSHGAASVNGILYAIGGGGFRSNLSSCESFDGKEWRCVAPLGLSRHALSVVSVRSGIIYAVGGWIDGKECSDTVEKYDTANDKWEYVAKLNLPRRLHGVAAFPYESSNETIADCLDKIYVFGGNCNDPHWHTNTVEVYDPISDSWQYLCPLPVAGGAAAVALGPFIFVFMHGKYVVRYDPRTDIHYKLSKLPLPEWHCFDVAAITGTTHIYVLGGISDGNWCKAMYLYDASTDSWEELPSMAHPRRRCASALVMIENEIAPSADQPTTSSLLNIATKKQKTTV